MEGQGRHDTAWEEKARRGDTRGHTSLVKPGGCLARKEACEGVHESDFKRPAALQGSDHGVLSMFFGSTPAAAIAALGVGARLIRAGVIM